MRPMKKTKVGHFFLSKVTSFRLGQAWDHMVKENKSNRRLPSSPQKMPMFGQTRGKVV